MNGGQLTGLPAWRDHFDLHEIIDVLRDHLPMTAGQFVGPLHRFLLPVGPVDERIVDGDAVRMHHIADHHQAILSVEIDALNSVQLCVGPVQATLFVVDRQSCSIAEDWKAKEIER